MVAVTDFTSSIVHHSSSMRLRYYPVSVTLVGALLEEVTLSPWPENLIFHTSSPSLAEFPVGLLTGK